MVFLFSEAVAMAIEFGNFDCDEATIGTHAFGNLLNIATSVYQLFYLIIGEHKLSGEKIGFIRHSVFAHIEKVVIYRYMVQSVFITLITLSFFTGSAFVRVSGSAENFENHL